MSWYSPRFDLSVFGERERDLQFNSANVYIRSSFFESDLVRLFLDSYLLICSFYRYNFRSY